MDNPASFLNFRRKQSWSLSIFLSITLLGFSFWTGASSQALAPAITWPHLSLTQYVGGFSSPTAIINAGDNSNRLFILEQAGKIRIIQNGSILATPFLDISNRVQFNGERGLLGLAFPPNYASKKYFYVYYTNVDGNNVVSRFHLTANANAADPNSEEQILLLLHPTFANHNGGQLAFGADGFLYIGTGDGGGGGDPQGNAQNLGSLLGKILRIDVEQGRQAAAARLSAATLGTNLIFFPFIQGRSGTTTAYAIPPGNPFVNTPGARPEIWAYGLRNPWRFSFDRQTHDLYIADVGQNLYEEVDFQPAGSAGGQNYGWNIMEGFHCYNSTTCNQTGLTLPVAEYSHGTNDSIGCSITGGFVYRGPGNSGMQGMYFYGDYCSGKIWGLKNDGGTWQSQQLQVTTPAQPHISTWGMDEQGNLYLADYAAGVIYRVNQAP